MIKAKFDPNNPHGVRSRLAGVAWGTAAGAGVRYPGRNALA